MNASDSGQQPAPTEWSTREGVRFEVAEDLFADLIGWCSGELTAEEAKASPDDQRLEQLRAQMAAYAAERRALDGTDPRAVSEVIEKYGPLVRSLYHGESPSA